MAFDPLEIARSLGSEEVPTTDMVKRGYHGNGTWDDDPATMQALTERSREVGAKRRAARIAAYDAKMIEGLEHAAGLQVELAEEALRTLRECKTDSRTPTKEEMDVIKRGQVAAEQIPNRVIGKAAQRVEHSGQVDLVSIIAGETGVEEFEVEDAEVWEDDGRDGQDDNDDDSWSDE